MKSIQSNLLLLSCCFFIFMFTSCGQGRKGVTGKGKIVEKTFELTKDFDQLSVAAGWKVELIKSDHPKMVVQTHENILPLLQYDVNGKTLHIGFKKGFTLRQVKTQKIKLYYQELSTIKVSSAASVFSDELFEQNAIDLRASSAADMNLQLKTGRTTVKTSSASAVTLKGTSLNFEGQSSSASSIKGKGLKTKNAVLRASSAANIDLQVLNELEARSNSGADINYYGSPTIKNLNHSSGGSIRQKS